MTRQFLRTSIVQEGHPRTGYRLRCSKCGGTEEILSGGHGHSLDNTFIGRKFAQKGWLVGRNESGDRCPSCLSGKKEKPIMAEVPKVVPMKAEPPREMSREDKRLIFGKLDGVYLDEKRGYENGWSDGQVAKDLGVPLAWVKTVREENFGPEGMSADARASIEEIRKFNTELETLRAILGDTAKRVKALEDASHRSFKIADDLERVYGVRRA